MGQRHSSNVSAAMSARGMGYAKGTHLRKTSTTVGPWRAGVGGSMGGSCGGGCDPKMGPNWALSGCAPSSRPYGLNWGYQRNHQRWPPNKRVGPFPVSQRPYYVGYAVPTYMEPFAGCPTRGAPYWVQEPCDQPGIGRPGLTKKPKGLGRRGLTGAGRRAVGYPKGTHLRATSVTVGPWRAQGCRAEGQEGDEGIGWSPALMKLACIAACDKMPSDTMDRYQAKMACYTKCQGQIASRPSGGASPSRPQPGLRARGIAPTKRGTWAASFSR